jgi:Tol biopolymer transport system component
VTLSAGTRLGPYEILSPLGAGGMGEVYRARDGKLNREVAIKVLPEAVAEDAERLARFQREAQVLAALNHPHIAAIYGLEKSGNVEALVLELVEGETLAERIAAGPIPVEEALGMARQIADALEAAHEKGIVHRDLKPANVKLTPGGKIKVLDFGLAKALTGDGTSPDVTSSPTLTAKATQAGMIIGTAAYMSPEQARGKLVDKRADIWAFGALLYEMLTGRRAFEGETVSDTLAAVLKTDPDWSALPAQTPANVRKVLRRCLERDRDRRLHDIADVRIEIEEGPGTDVESGVLLPPLARPASRLRRLLLAVGSVVVFLAGLGVGSRLLSRSVVRMAASPVRFTIRPPASVKTILNPAFASDGTFVVYEGWIDGRPRLFLHRFDAIDSRLLPGSEGAFLPFVSPDSRWIGFNQGGKLKKVAVAGGDALTLCEDPVGSSASWLPDGTVLFAHGWLGGLWAVSADGGKPRQLTTPDAAHGEKGHFWPRSLPGGRSVLFTIWRAGAGLNESSIALLDVSTGRYRVLFPGADARPLPPGHVVFYRAGGYHAIPFDFATLRVTGDPVAVLNEAAELDPDADNRLPVDIASTGALVFVPGHRYSEGTLAWVEPGRAAERLSFAPHSYESMSLSPDGRVLAAVTLESGAWVIRLLDLVRGTDERLEVSGGNTNVVWRPDGKGIAFKSTRKGDFDTYWKDLAAGGPEEPLLTSDGDESPVGWTPDGKRLLVKVSEPDGSYPIKLLTIGEGGKLPTVVPPPANVFGTSVSRDGRWLAFSSDSSGASEIYVQPFPGPGKAIRVSRAGGSQPLWSPEGRELFFRRGDEIIALSFRIEAESFIAGNERVVLKAPTAEEGSGSLITLDGKRFLILERTVEPQPPQLRVVLNWATEVDQKAAARR